MPGLNFINILRTAFAPTDAERVKNQLRLQNIFMLLGSACVKAARRTLMKLTPSCKKIFTFSFPGSKTSVSPYHVTLLNIWRQMGEPPNVI